MGNGAGQTIAIVDAFFDPNIQSDLGKFDAQFGLAAPPSFTQFVESGLRTENVSWALETALDVEWAHAIAPAANIVLVEADPRSQRPVERGQFRRHSAGRLGGVA